MAEQEQLTMPPPPGATQAAPRPFLGPVLVEVATPRNEQLLWGPTGQRLRGRWEWHNLPRGATSERGLSKMPVVPGMMIRVDPQRREAETFDPLGLPDNRPQLELISREHLALFGQAVAPVPPVKLLRLSDDRLATWFYWLYRFRQSGKLRVIHGVVPTVRELAEHFRGARVQRSFFDSTAYRKQPVVAADQLASEEPDEDDGRPPPPDGP